MNHLRLDEDGYCFVCGRKNHIGLNLGFTSANGKTFTEFTAQKMHQGFKDIVHGGIITAVLDEAMVKAVLSRGIEALTAEIEVRFISPLSVGEKAFIEAEIEKTGRKLIITLARLKKRDNTLVAEARAKLIRNV